MEALDILARQGVRVHGWEGWLVHGDGSVCHSSKYRCSTDLSSMPVSSAIALVKAAIMQANTEWQERSEAAGADLYFGIGVGG